MNTDVSLAIQNQIREGKLSHAYLIEINDYQSFESELKDILKTLLCEDNEIYCDKCQNCSYIDNFEHPNVFIVKPNGIYIKIDQIDYLREKLKFKSVFARYNIYVISYAENLNSTSANSILKLLEEPESNIIAILLTQNKSLVLPTIVSRCQNFKSVKSICERNDELQSLALKIEEYSKSWEKIINYYEIFDGINDKTDIKNAFNIILEKELKKSSNLKKIDILKEIIEQMRYNVNIDLLLFKYLIKVCELNE